MDTSEIEKEKSHIIVEIIQYIANAVLNDFYYSKKRLQGVYFTS